MRLLITGGTGSLGNALVSHFLKTTDYRLVVLSRDELKQYEMRVRFPDPRLEFFLGDVRDLSRLSLAFDGGIETVIHAAALKRVDSVAHDPDEVFKTNVEGTRNVLHASRGKVNRVLLISSDKACYPTNAYGISKAMAESLVTSFNVYGYPAGTSSSVVRYGNVLGSRGSVVEVWRRLRHFALPITDLGMTRFIITMEQAVGLIRRALDEMVGGEVFVPRIPAAHLPDLGRAIHPSAQFVITGLRPGGEKLHETLLTEEEAERSIDTQGMTVILPHLHPWTDTYRWHEYARCVTGERRSDQVTKLTVEELRTYLESI